MTDQPLTSKTIKAEMKAVGFGPGWGGNCATWIVAALACDSIDRKTVREFMGYKEWFDTAADKLAGAGYLKRSKLRVPDDLFDPKLGTITLILIAMEIDGLVVRVPKEST